MQIALNRITLDHRAQPRASLDIALVNEYAELMRAGVQFPDLKVFFDGKRHYLADGFHRHPAALAANCREFGCNISDGTLRDAILYSCKANAAHGLRRSDEDKRRAVKALLEDGEWGQWSDREIARQCAVSHPFVARIREEKAPVTGNVTSENRIFRTRHGTVSEMKIRARSGEPARDAQARPSSVGEASDAPPAHAAITILARSVCDVKASPQDVVAGCQDDDARDDLHEACEGAVAKLGDVMKVLDGRGHKRSA